MQDQQMIQWKIYKDSKCSDEFLTNSKWMSQLFFKVRRFIRFERSPSVYEVIASLWISQSYHVSKTSRKPCT